jgi:hypothetical protein
VDCLEGVGPLQVEDDIGISQQPGMPEHNLIFFANQAHAAQISNDRALRIGPTNEFSSAFTSTTCYIKAIPPTRHVFSRGPAVGDMVWAKRVHSAAVWSASTSAQHLCFEGRQFLTLQVIFRNNTLMSLSML